MNQREIKFRAWSKKSKKMLMDVQNMYDGLGDWFDNHGKEIDPYDGFSVTSFREVLKDENCVVMQYTGLKDKNGKEIYEGDVVIKPQFQGDPIKGVVEDDGGVYVMRLSPRYTVAIFKGEGFVEIIGNIYENPELLNPSP